ncbi:ABC transporter permease [Candidatus Saccharibacteria bacterium]|nr:ABC transporter permease [Candidatus Saccharibacteria bacterium]
MSDLKRTFLPVTTYVPIDIKRLFRDKVAIFFVFIFPLIFLLIFGSIFGGDSSVSFRVAIFNQSQSEIASNLVSQMRDTGLFNIDEGLTDEVAAREKMSRGQLDAAIIVPSEFGSTQKDNATPSGEVKILYDQGNESGGQTLASIMDSMMESVNSQFVNISVPFTVKTESTATAGLSRFDYTFSGILGFTLLSLGIFGPTSVFPRMKQKGVLRRYEATTLKVWQFFLGNVLSNAFIGLLALVLMFVSAVVVFKLNMRGSYINLAIIVAVGTVLMYGIGLAIGGWAKNENQAAPISQLVVLPMMFLSGVFFPVFLMPEVLQNITRFIPLTPIIDSIRLIITENASLLDLGPQLAVIGGWIVIIYILAFKLFRWE